MQRETREEVVVVEDQVVEAEQVGEEVIPIGILMKTVRFNRTATETENRVKERVDQAAVAEEDGNALLKIQEEKEEGARMKRQEAQEILKATAKQEEVEGDETWVGGEEITTGGGVVEVKMKGKLRFNPRLIRRLILPRLQTLGDMYAIRTLAVLLHQDLFQLLKMKVLVEMTTPL
jgi:hypothetical protein